MKNIASITIGLLLVFVSIPGIAQENKDCENQVTKPGDIPFYCPVPVPYQKPVEVKILPTPPIPGTLEATWKLENNARIRDINWLISIDPKSDLVSKKYGEYLLWLRATNRKVYLAELKKLDISEDVAHVFIYALINGIK